MIHPNSQQSWAVVGGGFLGMTLAFRLAEQGKAVTLFEAAPYLGGVASAWQLGDITWDRHYHVVLQSDTRLRSLLSELGLEKNVQWKRTRTGFFVDSRLYSMSDALEFLRFPPLNLVEKLRLGATILRASMIRDSETLEKIPAQDWLEKWSGKGVSQKIWIPLLRAKLGDSYRDTSAAFIWATIARMYAARRSGAKTEMFGYVPGGYARILNAFKQLLSRSGVNIRLGQPIWAIRRTGAGELNVELGPAYSERFSNVAVTAVAPVAADLCPSLQEEEKSRLRAIKHQGLVCASLLLKNPLSPFYITNIADSRIPFTAVIEMSALVDRSQFGGRSLVYLPKYLSPVAPYFGASDYQIRDEFLKSLEQMYPKFARDDVECFQISRVKHLLPVPTINHRANVPPITTTIPGLHLINSSQIVNGTLNVNETVRLAEAAARWFGSLPPTHRPVPNPFVHELVATHR